MSATEELRRLLDERGVEWIHGRLSSESTAWLDGNVAVVADEYGEGLLLVERKMTPEQAIDATLGRRATTRCGKFRTKYGRSVPCCECCGYGIGDERWHYCPSCGAKVVDA